MSTSTTCHPPSSTIQHPVLVPLATLLGVEGTSSRVLVLLTSLLGALVAKHYYYSPHTSEGCPWWWDKVNQTSTEHFLRVFPASVRLDFHLPTCQSTYLSPDLTIKVNQSLLLLSLFPAQRTTHRRCRVNGSSATCCATHRAPRLREVAEVSTWDLNSLHTNKT